MNRFLVAAGALLLAGAGAWAAEPISFRGRTVTMVIGYASGGGTDVSGRLIASFLGNHLPGSPTLVVQNIPGADGLTCLAQIRKRYPDVKVIILSASTDENVIQTALKRGASAYIVKSISPIDLPAALRQAIEGNVFSAIGMPEHNDSAARAAGLTDRETAILTALARGLSNEAIGKELWVAEQTVKFHLTNIYRKLGVSNRTEAARLAYQNGLVEMPVEDH